MQGIITPYTIIAPCGASLILVQLNTTLLDTTEVFGVQFDYELVEELPGSNCAAYIDSLTPKKPSVDVLTPILAVGFGIIGLVGILFVIMKIKRHWNDPPKKRKYKVIIPHPYHTPRLDAFRNKLLAAGTCCVCNDHCNFG